MKKIWWILIGILILLGGGIYFLYDYGKYGNDICTMTATWQINKETGQCLWHGNGCLRGRGYKFVKDIKTECDCYNLELDEIKEEWTEETKKFSNYINEQTINQCLYRKGEITEEEIRKRMEKSTPF